MQTGYIKAAGFLAATLLLGGLAAAQNPDCPAPIGIPRPAACQETVLVFVTQAAFQGNFGGLSGADAL